MIKNWFTKVSYFLVFLLMLTATSCNIFLSMFEPDEAYRLVVETESDNPVIYYTQTIQFHAFKEYEDGHREDVTRNVSWKSSDTDKVKIDDTGLVTPIANSNYMVAISAQLNTLYDTETLTIKASAPNATQEPTSEPTPEATIEPTPEPIIVIDPGFEEGSESWILDGAVFSAADYYNDGGSQSVFIFEGGTKVTQTLHLLEPSTNYKLTFYMKGIDNGLNFGTIQVNFYITLPTAFFSSGNSIGDGNWLRFDINFTTPADITNGVIIEFHRVKSSIYLDAVSVMPR